MTIIFVSIKIGSKLKTINKRNLRKLCTSFFNKHKLLLYRITVQWAKITQKLKYRLIGTERFSYLQIIYFTLCKLNEINLHGITRMHISKGV